MQTTFMERAVALARQAVESGEGGPFGAVIVKDGNIIAEAHNQVTGLLDPTAHAEIQAIRVAAQKLNQKHLTGCELYASSEPCPMCLAAAYWAHLENIYYACPQNVAAQHGFDDTRIYEEVRKPAEERIIPLISVPVSSREQPFQEWHQKTNKQPY